QSGKSSRRHIISSVAKSPRGRPESTTLPPFGGGMSLAAISLSALVAALVISCFSEINIGVLAIVFAWVVGVYFGGMKVDQVIAGFPTALFLTLVALTLLFAQAQVNGTLDAFARRAVRLCRGNAGVIPMMFFAVTALLSSIGPGNIAATALVAP